MLLHAEREHIQPTLKGDDKAGLLLTLQICFPRTISEVRPTQYSVMAYAGEDSKKQ